MEHSEIHEIICKSKKGDTHAFRHLVEHYQAYAYSLAFRVVYHEEEAEDIVQESFMKVWTNIHTYRNEMKFSTWLYRIVVNLSLDKLRKMKRTPRKWDRTDTSDDHARIAADNDQEKELINEEQTAWIRKLTNQLTTKQKLVFILRDLEGLDLKEISTVLSMTKEQIKSNLYHARKYIREKINRINEIGVVNHEMQKN